MAAFDTSPTGSAEVARDDIEAGMKGLFKVAQFRAKRDAREASSRGREAGELARKRLEQVVP